MLNSVVTHCNTIFIIKKVKYSKKSTLNRCHLRFLLIYL